MAYEKTEWKARKGVNLKRFSKESETPGSVILHNEPSSVSEPGTPFSTDNMNKIEQGIFDAHEMVADEEKARAEGDVEVLSSAKEFAQEKLSEHNNSEVAHEDIRTIISEGFADVNEKIADEELARAEGDMEVLSSAKEFTQDKIAEHNNSETAHAFIRNIVNNHMGLPAWDNSTHTLTFTAENGETLEIDLPLEKLTQDIGYDPDEKELILTKLDGDEIRINISDLIDVYEGSIGDHIQITVESGNVIKASLLNDSVGEEQIATELLEKIDGKIDTSEKGEANGVATLDGEGKVPMEQLPDNLTGEYEALLNAVKEIALNTAYPVGSVYASATLSTPAQVAEAVGGTWEAFAQGRTLVGVNTGDADFNAPNKAGGAKTHTLTVAQMPSHNHPMRRHDNSGNFGTTWTGRVDNLRTGECSETIQSSGGNQAHNNLQPYITVYFYKRIG